MEEWGVRAPGEVRRCVLSIFVAERHVLSLLSSFLLRTVSFEVFFFPKCVNRATNECHLYTVPEVHLRYRQQHRGVQRVRVR